MAAKTFCDGHAELSGRLKDVETRQGLRDCGKHAAEIKAIDNKITGLEQDSCDQWTAINQLRQKVWGWTPIMSFLGAVAGTVAVGVILYYLGIKGH